MSFISLHNHSNYSILDSTISVKKLAELAKENNMKAIALTDSGNLYGAIEFYKACKSLAIKPIIGLEIMIAHGSRLDKKKIGHFPLAYPIVLIAKNEKGYKNLCTLSSKSFLEGFYYYPRIDKELLEKHSDGLICLSGPISSNIGYKILNASLAEQEEEIKWFFNLFKDDFYFEITNHQMKNEDIDADSLRKETWLFEQYQDYSKKQNKIKSALFDFSKKFSIKCIATNDVHYEKRKDWRAHEILLNIASSETCEIWERDAHGNPRHKIANPKRKTYPSHEFYFKNSSEMETLFLDSPKCLDNTLEIVEKCSFEFNFDKKHYPVFTTDEIKATDDNRESKIKKYLYDLCFNAIEKRYTANNLKNVRKIYPNQDPLDVVQKRLNYEFDLISSKGMCDYFLIVNDFIAWAKNQNIPMGPGRGSAAGSIISYLLGITDIEPLRFNLFFERFINPERIAYPDIDVDICMDRRPEVIEYTVKKYGKEKVAQIITFGTMKAKMAIKDVGRVLSISLTKVNAIAKLVPEDPNMTLEKALEIDPELKQLYLDDEEAKRIIDIAKSIEGSIRNTSTHAAGIIISANSLTDHIPICIAKDSEMVVTQYSMKPVESIGLLKIDFLGLKTLTSIQKAKEFVKRNYQLDIDWVNLPLDDKPTFDLLNQGKTQGLFQLESSGMQELAKQLHIDVFEEIIAINALYRPGPMDMIPSYIARKHGKEKIEIDHPLMKEILSETYGVMVYQEQVMQIASKLAGYSLGEGDVLRRAMGKKDHLEMTKQREKFIKGAEKNNIDPKIAASIFDKIEKFASYGFNKSHATAYGYISYVTAFFKANYPKEWMAALMTCERDDISKIAKYIRECKSLSIKILPPDVNEAEDEFIATKDGIRFALSAIKGIGANVVIAIVLERQKNGIYKNLSDFIKRIDKSKVGKKNIELLIDSGSFDFLKISRDEMKMKIEKFYENALKDENDLSKGIMNLFEIHEEDTIKPTSSFFHSTELEKLHKEKLLLGFYLTGHPMDKYKDILKKLSCVPLKDFERLEDNSIIRASFIIDEVKFKISKSQKKFAILTISDGDERFELPIWPELYSKKALLLIENQLLYAILQIEKTDTIKIQCKWLEDLTKIDDKMIKEFDDLFDKLKEQSSFENKKPKNFLSKKQDNIKKENKDNIVSDIKLSIDANKIRFSQILNLKEIIKTNPGATKVEIIFIANDKKISHLELDSTSKINFTSDVKNKILTIPGIALQI